MIVCCFLSDFYSTRACQYGYLSAVSRDVFARHQEIMASKFRGAVAFGSDLWRHAAICKSTSKDAKNATECSVSRAACAWQPGRVCLSACHVQGLRQLSCSAVNGSFRCEIRFPMQRRHMSFLEIVGTSKGYQRKEISVATCDGSRYLLPHAM